MIYFQDIIWLTGLYSDLISHKIIENVTYGIFQIFHMSRKLGCMNAHCLITWSYDKPVVEKDV